MRVDGVFGVFVFLDVFRVFDIDAAEDCCFRAARESGRGCCADVDEEIDVDCGGGIVDDDDTFW